MAIKHTTQQIALKNGANGLLINVPGAGSVHFDIYFRAGGQFSPSPEKSQTAHIMEHLAFGANERFDSLEAFSREFSKGGARHNAFTSHTDMWYEADASLAEWSRILELQLLAISKPVYSEKALEAEKGNVREEIKGYASRHHRVLWQEMVRAAGLQRWYDPKELATIDPVTLEDIHAHFISTHTTNNMRFIVAGDLAAHEDAITRQLEAIDLPSGEQLAFAPERAAKASPVYIKRDELSSVMFALSFYINDVFTPEDYAPMRVLSHVLTDTFHSRIFGEVRARGICYQLHSYFVTSPGGTTEFTFGGQVSPDNAREVFELIAKELASVAEAGITETELADAKAYRLGVLAMTRETPAALANWYRDLYTHFEYVDNLGNVPERLEKVTVDDVRRVAQKIIKSEARILGGVGAGPESDFVALDEIFAQAFDKQV